eukprot:403477_1
MIISILTDLWIIYKGFCQLLLAILYKLFDNNVRVCKYGSKFRHSIDIYLQNNQSNYGKVPVICFLSGGGFIFGHKYWCSRYGYTFQKLGYVVLNIDYPRAPFSTIENQIEDCSKAIQWVFDNVQQYNGDINNINVVGFSAGGHVLLNALLQQRSQTNTWKPTQLKSVVFLSVPMDLKPIINALIFKRFQEFMFKQLFGISLQQFVKDYCVGTELKTLIENGEINPEDFCPMHVVNGTIDSLCRYEKARNLHKFLKKYGFNTNFRRLSNWNHLDVIVNDVDYFASKILFVLDEST